MPRKKRYRFSTRFDLAKQRKRRKPADGRPPFEPPSGLESCSSSQIGSSDEQFPLETLSDSDGEPILETLSDSDVEPLLETLSDREPCSSQSLLPLPSSDEQTLILVDLSLSQNLPLQRTTTLEQRCTTINLTEIHKYLTKKRPSFLQPTKFTMATTGSPFLAESSSKSIIISLCFCLKSLLNSK